MQLLYMIYQKFKNEVNRLCLCLLNYYTFDLIITGLKWIISKTPNRRKYKVDKAFGNYNNNGLVWFF